MSKTEPRGAVIEILQTRRPASSETLGDSVIIPDDVRINGQSLLCSAEDPVTVHETNTRADELVSVTLTLLARRVIIGAEEDQEFGR